MSKSATWYRDYFRRTRPANVAVCGWIGHPTTRDGVSVRLAELPDGRHVWASWGSANGSSEYYWGPINPRSCGHSANWQAVAADGEYCAHVDHTLTLSVTDDGALPQSDFINRDGDGWATVWAHAASKIICKATPEDVSQMTDYARSMA